MMLMPLVSVIVPVHDNEQWLPNCLDSIIGQTYHNLDIILIDDGSDIPAANICDTYAKEDGRIKVHHVKNGGVSRARNIGLEYATGEYVIFVDSDDWLDLDIICKAVKWQISNPNCLCKWSFVLFDECGTAKYNNFKMTHFISLLDWKATVIRETYEGVFDSSMRAVWGGMFSMDIIRKNHLRFQKGLYIGEDAVFLLEYSNYISGVKFWDYGGYYYRIHSESAVRKYKKDLLEQIKRQKAGIISALSTDELAEDIIDEAFVGFIWLGFNDLIDNGRKGWSQKLLSCRGIKEEALIWMKENRKFVYGKKLSVQTDGKFIYLEHILSGFIPIQIVCFLAICRSIWKNRL